MSSPIHVPSPDLPAEWCEPAAQGLVAIDCRLGFGLVGKDRASAVASSAQCKEPQCDPAAPFVARAHAWGKRFLSAAVTPVGHFHPPRSSVKGGCFFMLEADFLVQQPKPRIIS